MHSGHTQNASRVFGGEKLRQRAASWIFFLTSATTSWHLPPSNSPTFQFITDHLFLRILSVWRVKKNPNCTSTINEIHESQIPKLTARSLHLLLEACTPPWFDRFLPGSAATNGPWHPDGFRVEFLRSMLGQPLLGASFFGGVPEAFSEILPQKNQAFKVFKDIGAFHYTEFRFLLHKASSGVVLFILPQNPHLTDWTGFVFPSMGYPGTHRQPHSAKVSPPHDLFAILCVLRMICHELLIP